ncbi:hypothetical protein Y032_0569g68 [Ancylostoma ceylanicum]|uniref:Uncharacterized protein n=1 Tax=Ancylostoma ceylanicum TaxID=53326 RepID=A0A016WQV7_9BILA|nr:hypothetical protein Y032_0569g68 [Ancylostoma ceylanicum]
MQKEKWEEGGRTVNSKRSQTRCGTAAWRSWAETQGLSMLACRAPMSLPKNAALRSHRLFKAVCSSRIFAD